MYQLKGHCEGLLFLLVSCDNELNVFKFWRVAQTKKETSSVMIRLTLGNCDSQNKSSDQNNCRST